jgi:hypothetical protein
MNMELFAKDTTDEEFKKIAVGYWFNEDAKEEMSAESKADLSDQPFIQKLKLLQNGDNVDITESKSLMLRIAARKDPFYIMNHLKNKEPCFSFDLSIFAKREKHDSESEEDRVLHSRGEYFAKMKEKASNTLIRVDWKGKKSSEHHFY